MSWAGLAKIQTLLESAGAAMIEPITLVRRGAPWSVPQPMIRWWYEGNGDAPAGPDTFNATQEGLQFTIGVYVPWPGLEIEAEAAADRRIEDADDKIQAALWGDVYLGTPGSGNAAMHLQIGDTHAGVVPMATGPAAIALEIPVTYSVADRHAITP